MFRKLLDKYIQDPIIFTVGVFITLFLIGAIRYQLKPYYSALIEDTGGGLAAFVEMYNNVELTIVLLFQ